jgi:inosine-uridine nucleoside N-ribohydrolase
MSTSPPKKIPVLLDTDIGYDIDDTWALALLLKCPEVDLKLVVSATHETTYGAKLLAKFLALSGRPDIPVGVGLHFTDQVGGQAPWVANYNLASYPGQVHEDGVQALIDTIMTSPEPVTLLAIDPLPNIGEALRREPRLADRCRFVGMHGSLRLGYNGDPEIAKEYNVACHTPDCQAAFTAPWDMTITPLDTCGLITLTGDKYQKILASPDPMTQMIIENYRLWSHWGTRDRDYWKHQSSTLFDTVAVYLTFCEDLINMEPLGVRVTDDGYTVIDETEKKMDCAMSWKDLGAFEDLLVERLAG